MATKAHFHQRNGIEEQPTLPSSLEPNCRATASLCALARLLAQQAAREWELSVVLKQPSRMAAGHG